MYYGKIVKWYVGDGNSKIFGDRDIVLTLPLISFGLRKVIYPLGSIFSLKSVFHLG